jgi:hypothetical protein
MKFSKFLNELANEKYGKGITFIDIDETIFHTFAKIYVMKDGKVVRKLNNQEFNTYELQPDESFDFREFRNAKMFKKTSIPIPKTVKRIKRMLQNIKRRGSKIIFLTARSDFDNKTEFLSTFQRHGIPMADIYVERAGNRQEGTVAKAKKNIVMEYLNTGEFRRVRLIDDDMTNLKKFLSIAKNITQHIIDKVKDRYNIKEGEVDNIIEFFALHVKENGKLEKIN